MTRDVTNNVIEHHTSEHMINDHMWDHMINEVIVIICAQHIVRSGMSALYWHSIITSDIERHWAYYLVSESSIYVR